MTKHLGDFDLSAVIYSKFATFRPSTGAAFTLGGTPALSVYKDNSVTQSTTGVTLTADFDSVTGLNHLAIDTSADGTFYSAGSFFDVVITTGTVDSVSVVGAVVASFTIRKSSSLKPVTAGRALVVDAAGLADANVVKIGPTGAGTAQTARDIGASVLLSAGAGTGQLDFTSGVVKANATQWLGGTIPAVNVTGVPLVDLKYTLGTISPATAGSVRADAVTGAVGSVTGNVGGSVASVTAGVTVTTNNDKTGYALTAGAYNAAADALLARNVAGGSSTGRIVAEAFYFLRNKWTVAAGTLTVYGTDDTTSAWTATVGATPGADPITSNDPA